MRYTRFSYFVHTCSVWFDHFLTHKHVQRTRCCSAQIDSLFTERKRRRRRKIIHVRIGTYVQSVIQPYVFSFFAIDEQLTINTRSKHHFPTKSQGVCNQTFFTHPFFSCILLCTCNSHFTF